MYMIKYTFGEIFTSGGATLCKNPSDQTVSNDSSDDSIVFKQAKDHYMACMDLDNLDLIGIQPLKDMLKEFGGWPVLEDNWDESNFNWYVIIKDVIVPGLGRT